METMDELLAKYMLGEAKLTEIELIDQWISASKHNLRYFTHFKLIWETSGVLKMESTINVEDAWEEFKELVEKSTRREAAIRQLQPQKRWMKIAAIWISIFGIAGLLYSILSPGKPVMLTAQTANQVRIDTLTDGSVITLNKNSALYYPDRFAGNTREVKLQQGEAFFNIASNKHKPFLIRINDVLVKVVGTSFNIKSTGKNTEVIVESGTVQVIRRKVIIKLRPGEKVNINYKGDELRKEQNTDELYNYYRTHQFVLNNTPLWRVVEVLNEAYNSRIVIADKKLNNQPLTTTLKVGSLDNNLYIICKSLSVRTVKHENKIMIQ
jgi:transmembrane sensor